MRILKMRPKKDSAYGQADRHSLDCGTKKNLKGERHSGIVGKTPRAKSRGLRVKYFDDPGRIFGRKGRFADG
jgi:hypothetical protein